MLLAFQVPLSLKQFLQVLLDSFLCVVESDRLDQSHDLVRLRLGEHLVDPVADLAQWLDRYIIDIFERISGDGIFLLPLAFRLREHE